MLEPPTWVLAVSWVVPFGAAALIAWWPRWKAAWKAFWPATSELDIRRVRLLEYHAMHLSWLRWVYTTPSTSEALIDGGRGVIKKHRDLLLNLTPDVFSQSVVDAFREPPSLKVGEKVKFVQGMSKEPERAILVAQIDHLMTAVRNQWLALDGQLAERP